MNAFQKSFATSTFVTNELWYCWCAWNMWRYFEHSRCLHINLILLFIDSLFVGWFGWLFLSSFLSTLAFFWSNDAVGQCVSFSFSFSIFQFLFYSYGMEIHLEQIFKFRQCAFLLVSLRSFHFGVCLAAQYSGCERKHVGSNFSEKFFLLTAIYKFMTEHSSWMAVVAAPPPPLLNDTNVNYQMAPFIFIHTIVKHLWHLFGDASQREAKSAGKMKMHLVNRIDNCIRIHICKWRIRKSILHLAGKCSMCFGETSVERWAKCVNIKFVAEWVLCGALPLIDEHSNQ